MTDTKAVDVLKGFLHTLRLEVHKQSGKPKIDFSSIEGHREIPPKYKTLEQAIVALEFVADGLSEFEDTDAGTS